MKQLLDYSQYDYCVYFVWQHLGKLGIIVEGNTLFHESGRALDPKAGHFMRNDFIYDREDGTIISYGEESYIIYKSNSLPEGSKYIDDSTNLLEELMAMTSKYSFDTARKSIKMTAFVNYWKEIKKLLQFDFGLNLLKLHYFIMIPTHLGKQFNEYRSLLTSIFKEARILSKRDHPDRLLMATFLELQIVRARFVVKNEKLNRIITRKEEKCTVCEIHLSMEDNSQVHLHKIQLKKDYNLSIGLTDEYFFPKILESKTIYDDYFDLDTINDDVKDIIVSELNRHKRLLFQLNIKTVIDHIYHNTPREKHDNDTDQSQLLKQKLIKIHKHYRKLMINFEENLKHFQSTNGPVIFVISVSALFGNFEWFYDVVVEKVFSLERNRIYMHALLSQLHCFDDFLTEDIDMVKVSGLFGSDGAVFKVRKLIEVSNLKLQHTMIERPKSSVKRLSFPKLSAYIKNKLGNQYQPEVVIYIDIGMGSTNLLLHVVDLQGVIKEELNIPNCLPQSHSSLIQYLAAKDITIYDSRLFVKVRQHNKKKSTMIKRFSSSSLSSFHFSPKASNSLAKSRAYIMECFINYLKETLEVGVGFLKKTKHRKKHIGIIISVEKPLMNKLDFQSRYDLCTFLMDSKMTASVKNLCKISVIDRGSAQLWNLILKNKDLLPPSFFLHAYITDDSIHLKVYQLSTLNNIDNHPADRSIIFVKDQLIPITNIYDQAILLLWMYIQSDVSKEKIKYINTTCDIGNTVKDYMQFKETLSKLLKTKFFNYNSSNNKAYNAFDTAFVVPLSDTCFIKLTQYDILEIAIIPVLKQLMSTIISCIIDPNIFGHYRIPKIFITGNFIRTQNYNPLYHQIINSEIKKKFYGSLKSDIKNWLDFTIATSWKDKDTSNKVATKHFAYNDLTIGEPLIALNSSYLLTVQTNDTDSCIKVTNQSRSITSISSHNRDTYAFKLVEKGMHIGQEGIVGTFFLAPKNTVSNLGIRFIKGTEIDYSSREGLFRLRASAFTIRIVPLYYKSAFKLTVTYIGHYNEEIEEKTEVIFINERHRLVF